MPKELTMNIPIVIDDEVLDFLRRKILKENGVEVLRALADHEVVPLSPAHLKVEFITPSFTRGMDFRSEPPSRVMEDIKDKLSAEKESTEQESTEQDHPPAIIADMILSIPAEKQVKALEHLKVMPELYAAVAVSMATKLGEVE